MTKRKKIAAVAALAAAASVALPSSAMAFQDPIAVAQSARHDRYVDWTSGKVSPTPGAFPKSLENRAWMRQLARHMEVSIDLRAYRVPFRYVCWEAYPQYSIRRQWYKPRNNVQNNVLCYANRANGTSKPLYAVALWEDGSWVGRQVS